MTSAWEKSRSPSSASGPYCWASRRMTATSAPHSSSRGSLRPPATWPIGVTSMAAQRTLAGVKIEHFFAGLPVGELAIAQPWYEDLIGRAPDMTPHDKEVCWQLGGGWIYVVEDPERAG